MVGVWNIVWKAGTTILEKSIGGELFNQLMEKAGIDFEIPSIQEMAFAIMQMIASMLTPILAYIALLFIIGMIIWRFPEIIEPFIKQIALRFGREIGV